MKPVNVMFEDEEMVKLKEAKGEETWHDFVLRKCLEPSLGIDKTIINHLMGKEEKDMWGKLDDIK